MKEKKTIGATVFLAGVEGLDAGPGGVEKGMLLPGDSCFVAYSFEAPKKPGRVKAVMNMRLSLLDSDLSCTGDDVFPERDMEIEVTR